MERKGFTIVELVVAIMIVGVALAITLPRFRASPAQKVKAAATQLVRELEMARTRGLAAKRSARLVFNVTGNSYVGYEDYNGNGLFYENATEMEALRWPGVSQLSPDVRFGRGNATTSAPGDTTASGAVTFINGRLTFGKDGLTTPFGTRGAVYFVSSTSADVVAAVSVTGAGSFKVWLYQGGGAWR